MDRQVFGSIQLNKLGWLHDDQGGSNKISDAWDDTPSKMGSTKIDAAIAQEANVYFLQVLLKDINIFWTTR